MVYADNPLLAMLPKSEKFFGKQLVIPIQYGIPQSRATTIAAAQGITRDYVGVEQFVLTRVKDYAVAQIDNETIMASDSDEGAFMEAATAQVDGAIHTLTRSIAQKIYRDGYGSIGVIGSGYNTTTVTLSTIEDVVNFEVGQSLVFSASNSGAALRSATGTTVTAVNRSTGVLTLSAAPSAAGVAGNGEYIFPIGDRTNTAAYTSRLVISGLSGWIPSTAPTSGDSWFAADRSVDVTRLAGQRFDGSAMPIEEALVKAAIQVAREGQKISHYFMSYDKYAALELALGSKVQYVDIKVNPEVGFRGISINGPRGPIKVVPDHNCPSATCFGLNMETWKLHTLGKMVQPIDTDGLSMLRTATTDAVEIRYGFYGNLACSAPGSNVNVSL
jgi:hypothetical protein